MIHYGEVLSALDMEMAPYPVVLVANDREELATEITAAGGRLLARQHWPALATHPAVPGDAVVFADARGIDDASLAAAMPWLEELGQTSAAGGVLLLSLEQVDLVAPSLLAGRFTLLCDSSPADRAAALAIAHHAASGGVMLHDSSRNSEADRLRRLDEEVARIAGVLARLSRPAAEPVASIADRSFAFQAQPPAPEEEAATAQAVRKAIRARRLRDQLFEAGLFEDPAWDILLDLFAAKLEHGRVSVSSLCIAAAVAPTTALRWISRMTALDLLRREPDPFDRRRAFIGLSDRAVEGMRSYCRTVQAQGLAIA